LFAYVLCYNFVVSPGSLQAKAQQKASERAGIQFALKGATAGNIHREFQMYKQETDAKLDQANST
jgi:tellurite resistance protein